MHALMVGRLERGRGFIFGDERKVRWGWDEYMYTQDVVNDNGDATLNHRQRKPRTEMYPGSKLRQGYKAPITTCGKRLLVQATMTSQRLGEVASTYNGRN